MSEGSWYERMRLGFRKTSDRLGDNLSGLLTKSALDAVMLDEIGGDQDQIGRAHV